jgi:hypothetical protein
VYPRPFVAKLLAVFRALTPASANARGDPRHVPVSARQLAGLWRLVMGPVSDPMKLKTGEVEAVYGTVTGVRVRLASLTYVGIDAEELPRRRDVVAPDSVLAGSIEGSLGRSAPRATLPAWLSYA